MIKATKNYDIFKKHDFNREIVEGNVLKIMRSLQVKNLLEYRPILVDESMRVIDGQHRLEAARRLELPVYFEMKADVQPQDIILLNDNSKCWGRDDYLNFYCAQGNKEYIKLKKFIGEHKVSLATAMAVMGLDSGKNYKNPTTANSFKNGKFVFPSAHEEIDSVNILHHSQEVIEFLSPRMTGDRKFLKGPKFRRSLYNFLSIKAVDFEVFIHKLNYKLNIIRPCARIAEFVEIFKQIYNWMNKEPITTERDLIKAD